MVSLIHMAKAWLTLPQLLLVMLLRQPQQLLLLACSMGHNAEDRHCSRSKARQSRQFLSWQCLWQWLAALVDRCLLCYSFRNCSARGCDRPLRFAVYRCAVFVLLWVSGCLLLAAAAAAV